MAQIQTVSIRHEAILDFLMGYPNVSLGEVARHFGITQGWLSQVIHSDAFQSRLKEKQHIAFHHTVLPIREKMLNIAHQALDQLEKELPNEREPRNLSEIAGDVLDRLGFSAKTPAVVFNQQNNIHMSTLRNEIEEAQALLGAAGRPAALEVANHDGRPVIALPVAAGNGAAEIQGEDFARLGEAFAASALYVAECENGSRQAGGPIREEGDSEAGGTV